MSTSSKLQTETTEKLRLSGMDCGDCALTIEQSLLAMPGVQAAQVSFGASQARVSYAPDKVSQADIARRIEELGYRVERPAVRGGALEYSIEGMDCGDCALTIEKVVASLPGIASANVNFGSARLSVQAEDVAAGGLGEAIERKVAHVGYRVVPVSRRMSGPEIPFWRRDKRVITTAFGAMAVLLAFALHLVGMPVWVSNALYGAAIVVSGQGFARAGWLALLAKRADMNLLMSVAAVGAVALGDWAEAATVVLLFAFGGTLQAYTLEKTRGAIRSLMELSPQTALVRRTVASEMREIKVPVEEVAPGETVVVGPGERIPLDGVVLLGTSSVDQSPITGESVPVDVEPGAALYAGTINGHGVLEIRTEKAANNTALARIIEMVEEAQAQRAPSQGFVDQFSAVYTPVVIAAAALIALVPPILLSQPFGDWVYRALVLLVVACPCALVISTPVSIVAAIGAATKHGVLVKGGATLEALGRVRAVAFDKTGTLTEGRPQVVSVEAASGDHDGLLRLAAAAESRSEHPLARAVVHAARTSRRSDPMPQVSNFASIPGRGARSEIDRQVVYVGNKRFFSEAGLELNGASDRLDALQASGNTAVLVGTQDGVLGIIALADKPRPHAREAVQALRDAGVAHVVMLTGDNPRTAAAIAEQVGVLEYKAELLPDQKVEAVRGLLAQYGSVAMVGDGVNDAPALATATIGIAMGVAGTDAALEVADVALMGDDLSRIAYAVALSHKTLGIIKANVALSFASKGIALALAAVGMLPLWGAIFADMGVSLLVTLNGMRLLGFRWDGKDGA